MIKLFSHLKMHPSLAVALHAEGITTPTDVQRSVIPEALKNKDLVVQSETGTGKTLAYLLPLFEKIDPVRKEMQAIILAPTHELAIQILRQIERLSENSEIKLSSASAIGNVSIERQIDRLKEKPNIIVGSPGRVHELIKRRKIAAHTIKTIIIDEADTLTDESNIDVLKAVIKSTQKDRQLLMFSATITKRTEECAKEMMKEPEFIKERARASVPATIEHIYFEAEERDKTEVLRKAIGVMLPSRAMVFIGDREETEVCTDNLKYHGLRVGGMHGHTDKIDRKRAMDDFKSGKIQVLVVSDLAARGLDIEGVTHIFNLNVPEKSKEYLHRVGRTGRKGNVGMAVSIVTERERQFIRLYEKELKITIAAKDLYRGEMIDARKK
ncbi:MAG: DEAD/DEAH box helicase [Peptococcaceae bacterium]|nr:DEAD/DEAH box helicase [Peptococcaceae bacterium]